MTRKQIGLRAVVATVFAVAAVSVVTRCAHSQEAAPPHYDVSTGVTGGNYAFVGTALLKQLGAAHVALHPSGGSFDNLDAVYAGRSQFAPAQFYSYYEYTLIHSDALAVIEVARQMYPEYAHLICNKAVGEISDLTAKDTVAIGAKGSGSAAMWDTLIKANPKYAKVQTVPQNPVRALGQITQGGAVQCVLFVTGLNSQVMKEANDIAKTTPNLHLTYMRDPLLFGIKDGRGRPIYERGTIPSGTYEGGLQRTGYVTGSAVDTVVVQSVMVGNAAYAEQHPNEDEQFLLALNRAMPEILNHVGEQR